MYQSLQRYWRSSYLQPAKTLNAVTGKIVQQEGLCKPRLIGWLDCWRTSKMVDSSLRSCLVNDASNGKQTIDISLSIQPSLWIPTTLKYPPPIPSHYNCCSRGYVVQPIRRRLHDSSYCTVDPAQCLLLGVVAPTSGRLL